MARPSALRLLGAALEAAVGGVMMTAVLLNFSNVVARYVFFRPIVAAEEVLQLMNVWVVMLGAATITGDNRHLSMDALYRLMPRGLRRTVDALTAILTLGLTAYVMVQAVRVMMVLSASGQRSVTAGIPMALMYASIPLGFGCGLLFLVARLRAPTAERKTAMVVPAAGPEMP